MINVYSQAAKLFMNVLTLRMTSIYMFVLQIHKMK